MYKLDIEVAAMAPSTNSATMKIFYGPPGTGKTYLAAREAVKIIDQVLPATQEAFQERHQQLVAAKRIWWVTFHPSFSYEDFVEGFRPVTVENRLVYETQDGPFKLACQACLAPFSTTELRVGDKIGRYQIAHVDPGGVVLRSKVDRKDAVAPEILQYADFWTIERCRAAGFGPDDLRVPGKQYDKRGGLAQKTHLPTTLLTNSSHYAALWDYLEQKRQGRSEYPVVLVIDEINRADLSRVLGELVLLLESDKRNGEPNARSVILPYSKREFSVPRLLSVIGTMNTTDRSIALVDTALRRRFEFEEVNPDPQLCPKEYGGIDVQMLLNLWNHRVTALRSRDHQLGHSDFMESALDRVRRLCGWNNDEDGRARAVAKIIRSKTIPLLMEYFHEDWRKVDAVLGKRGLLAAQAFADVQDLIEDLADLSETTTYVVEDWWNPASQGWNAAKFRNTLKESRIASA